MSVRTLTSPLYIIIIILVARLLLKLGRGLLLLSPAHGLFKNESSARVMVDCLLRPLAPILALGGTGGSSIMLPLYSGPMSLSLTLLFLFGPSGAIGCAENLSNLSDPSAFFSPARMARSLFIAALCVSRRRFSQKNVPPTAIRIKTITMPIARPAAAPESKARFVKDVGNGEADAWSMMMQKREREAA